MKCLLRSFYIALFLLLPLSALADFDKLVPISDSVAKQLYNPNGNTVAGNPNGTITLVEFFDYNCPHCRAFSPKLEKLIAKNPNLRVVYKEYLLFGDSSIPATLGALAANRQGKYQQMHDAMLKATNPLQHPEVLRIAQTVGIDPQQLDKDMQNSATAKLIKDNEALVDAVKIDGAPTFIITNRDLSKNAKQGEYQEYVYQGDDGAAEALQKMIDALNAANKKST